MTKEVIGKFLVEISLPNGLDGVENGKMSGREWENFG